MDVTLNRERNKKAVLSLGEPRDAAVNFDTYRALHFSAKRGISIACCPSVRLSVTLGGSGPRRLEILETNCTDNYPNAFALRVPNAILLRPGEQWNMWQFWGDYRLVGKSGVLEHKCKRQYL